jgi:hypothetical protein
MTVAQEISQALDNMPGATDRAIAEWLGCRHQQVNGECRYLEQLGKVERRKGEDGLIHNYLVNVKPKLSLV